MLIEKDAIEAVNKIEKILADINFMPDWHACCFRNFQGSEDLVGVYLTTKVIDANTASIEHIENKREILSQHIYPAKEILRMSNNQILGMIKNLIWEMYTHEFHEWFRYKNARLNNPHPDQPDTPLPEEARIRTRLYKGKINGNT